MPKMTMVQEYGRYGSLVDISMHVDRIIELGYHTAAGSTSVDKYYQLWPRSVFLPKAYEGRFDLPLLVDRTIPPAVAIRLNSSDRANVSVSFGQVVDKVPAPSHPRLCVSLKRYVAWMRFDTSSRDHLDEDEVSLVLWEGVHLPGQHEEKLRKYGAELLGTCIREKRSHDPPKILRIWWFDRAAPNVDARPCGASSPDFVRATRGRYVVPVSW